MGGAFKIEAIWQLSKLNGEQRKLAELSSTKYKRESMGAELLIVGWIGNEPGAYQLCDNGTSFNVLPDGFAIIS